MGNNFGQKQGLVFFGLSVCLVILASCACDQFHDREVGVFHPEQVACDIHSTPEPEAIMAEVSKKKGSTRPIAERAAYVDKVLSDLKTLADQGDTSAMLFFGLVQYTAIGVDIMYKKYGHMTGRFYPDYLHDNLVTAYTYIYLSADVENERQRDAIDIAGKLDESGANETGLQTPPAWIEEAKANAERWVAHCASQ